MDTATAPTVTKKRVLVVEDDTHLLSGIRDILELEHYTVLTAKHGQDALAVLNSDPENPPDVIVSDIMMPHMDGFEFLENVRLQDMWVTVPFIFLTAKGEREDKHRASLGGADQFLTKPFDAEDLLVAVRSVVGRVDRITHSYELKMEDLKDKLMTIVNHELRTPLTLIVAYAEMLKDVEESNLPDEEKSFLKGVFSGADRMRRLIENFITVVDLRMGEADKTIAWRSQPLSVQYIVDAAYRQIAQPDTRPRTFTFDIPDDLPYPVMDEQYMTIAVRELLDNAAKFCNQGDEVTVRAEAEDDKMVKIQVIDNGRGIPAQELENIWKPFYQIKREVHEDQGAGSGLTIVDGIVRLHGGTRAIESIENKGTTVTIWLPTEKPSATSDA